MLDKLNAMKWTVKQWEWMLEHGPDDAKVYELKSMAVASEELDLPTIPLNCKCYLCTYTEQFFSKSRYYYCGECPMYGKWPHKSNVGNFKSNVGNEQGRCISFGSLFSSIESMKKKDCKKELKILVDAFRHSYEEMKENYTEEDARYDLARSVAEKFEDPWYVPFWLVQYKDYLESKNEKQYKWEDAIIDRFKSFDFNFFKKELSKLLHEYYDNKKAKRRSTATYC